MMGRFYLSATARKGKPTQPTRNRLHHRSVSAESACTQCGTRPGKLLKSTSRPVTEGRGDHLVRAATPQGDHVALCHTSKSPLSFTRWSTLLIGWM